jgi:hypothetical protein
MMVEVLALPHAPEGWLLGNDVGDDQMKNMGGNPLLNLLSNLLLGGGCVMLESHQCQLL